IERMWGVGKVTREALSRLGIRTFHDLSRMPVGLLERRFGKHGVAMHRLSLGIDNREVVPEHGVKSIGHEDTFAQDILDPVLARKELLSQTGRVARRMRRKGLEGRTVTLKVKYSDFVQITRSVTLPGATDDASEIYAAACALLEKTAVGKRPVRLLGVSLSQFSSQGREGQLSLFSQDRGPPRKRNLNAALDSIQEKFGDKGIRPGTLLDE
ncbi:MAG: DNA polymerase IV, partial [Deltaproteobacteria bacterium]|nr:DNA polymerase IV [Deltaproteobacteria bacterium]